MILSGALKPTGKKNMGLVDQFLRIGIGLGLVYAGFVDTDLIGIFGLTNTMASVFAKCPFYRIAGIDTQSFDHPSKLRPIAGLRARFLAATVILAVVVLGIFGTVAFRVAEDASELQGRSFLALTTQRLAHSLDEIHYEDIPLHLKAASEVNDYVRFENADGEILYSHPQAEKNLELWNMVQRSKAENSSSFRLADKYLHLG